MENGGETATVWKGGGQGWGEMGEAEELTDQGRLSEPEIGGEKVSRSKRAEDSPETDSV